jgi:hypothetical protein
MTSGWSIAFAPYMPAWTFILLGGIGVVLLAASLLAGGRGTLFRAGVLAGLLLLMANPRAVHEIRKAEPDIAVLVADDSESEDIGTRKAQRDAALAQLRAQIKADPSLELRELHLGRSADGTMIFGPLSRLLSDVQPERVAGLVLVTDGIVHDVPKSPAELPVHAPLHVLLTGSRNEADRKLTVLRAPVFGIVGEPVSLVLRVDDEGPEGSTQPVSQTDAGITISVDGHVVDERRIATGAEVSLPVTLSHGGENVIEVETEPGPSELTLFNNHAVVTANGVRDRLRVLLVTGEPHAGERTWRNLLKADPAVDLVHFTILRPPEKQDGTPIDELSLIAFPTRELFVEKLDQFDLIIFDRYRRHGVLPIVYLNNVASYVEHGGALLDAAGPSFATGLSLYRTPLAAVLPAQPTGAVFEEGFKPRLTLKGLHHPVTAGLKGANANENEDPQWGRWFRLIDSTPMSGDTLMTGAEGRPALVLSRVGEGRVAQLLSDESWLWARGFEGGGPQAELLRRLAHWLMKEPELEEEVLSGAVSQGVLTVTRRSMKDEVSPVTVTRPDGTDAIVPLSPDGKGFFHGAIPAKALGLYRLTDGTLSAIVAAGPLNPREYADVRATEARLAPLAKASGGGVHWLERLADGAPEIRRVEKSRIASGANWIGLRKNGQSTLTDVSERPLFPPLAALMTLALLLGLAWYRESR